MVEHVLRGGTDLPVDAGVVVPDDEVASAPAAAGIRTVGNGMVRGNEGQPLDLWEVRFSVYNGSDCALDHLIARYGIETKWPPCTSWDVVPDGHSSTTWSDTAGHMQRSGPASSTEPGETISETKLVLVFHADPPPRFANWSVDFDFADEGAAERPFAAGQKNENGDSETAAAVTEIGESDTALRPLCSPNPRALAGSRWKAGRAATSGIHMGCRV